MRYVARRTGLKPYLIRTWEERYAAVCPRRSETNRRLYSDADIERLILIKRAVDSGHTISTVAALSDSDLRSLVQAGDTETQRVDGETPSIRTPDAADPQEDSGERVRAALDHILRLDANGLERVLTAAAVELSRRAFVQQVVMPMFRQIGTLWQSGDLKIVNEHMASVTVRAILWDMLRTVEVAATAPRIVVATPVGHWHEFGALASALAASESGWRACYFGPNLPSEEIAYAAQQLEARALCLSLCHQLDDRHLPVEMTKLRRAIGDQLPLFVGGTGSSIVAKLSDRLKLSVVNDLDLFRQQLEEMLKKT